MLLWSTVLIVLLVSGLFFNFDSGELLSKNMSITGKLIIAVISCILVIPIALFLKLLFTESADVIPANTQMYMHLYNYIV